MGYGLLTGAYLKDRVALSDVSLMFEKEACGRMEANIRTDF
jgi:hypothetical protein